MHQVEYRAISLENTTSWPVNIQAYEFYRPGDSPGSPVSEPLQGTSTTINAPWSGKSSTDWSTGLRIGFLRTCTNGCLVELTREVVERVAGLGPTEYYHETGPGGAARKPNPIRIDSETGESIDAATYAHKNGARIFFWQACLDTCYGLPGLNKTELISRVGAWAQDHPNTQNYLLLASGKETLPNTNRSAGPRGFLKACIDRRFVEETLKAFKQVTGLGPTEYDCALHAGGAAGELNSDGESIDVATYVYDNGVEIFVWQAHGNNCGGLPGRDDEAINDKLTSRVEAWARGHPNTQNYLLFAKEKESSTGGVEIKIRKIYFSEGHLFNEAVKPVAKEKKTGEGEIEIPSSSGEVTDKAAALVADKNKNGVSPTNLAGAGVPLEHSKIEEIPSSPGRAAETSKTVVRSVSFTGLNRERLSGPSRAEEIKCALAIGGLTLTGLISVGATAAVLIIKAKK